MLIKTLIVTNIITAIIIYIAKLAEIETAFTWDLTLVLLLGIFVFCRDILFDLSTNILTILKNHFESIINYLNEIKINVDKENLNKFNEQVKKQMNQNNNITKPAKDAYVTLVDNGNIDNVQPKAKSGYVTYKTILIITGAVVLIGFLYLGWMNYDSLPDVLKKCYDIIVFLPTKFLIDFPIYLYRKFKVLAEGAYNGILESLNIFKKKKPTDLESGGEPLPGLGEPLPGLGDPLGEPLPRVGEPLGDPLPGGFGEQLPGNS